MDTVLLGVAVRMARPTFLYDAQLEAEETEHPNGEPGILVYAVGTDGERLGGGILFTEEEVAECALEGTFLARLDGGYCY